MRLALIRTLAWAPLSVRVALVALNAFLASWPALLAVTAGGVAGSVGAGGPGLAFAVVAFCVVLCLGDSFGHAADLARTHAARAVDGHVRSLVRRTLGSLPRIDLAERADLADDIALATMTSGPRGVEESIGSGAGAQLIVAFRLVGAVGTALLLVPLSPLYALVLFALTVVARQVSRRQWRRSAERSDADAAGRRRTEYWSELAAGEGAAKELRVFGLGRWLVRRRREEALAFLVPRWRERRRGVRSLWLIGLISFASALLVLGVPAWQALQGAVSPEDMVRYIVAGFGLVMMSFVWQAFTIEQAKVSLAALDRIRARAAQVSASGQPVSEGPVELEGVTFAYGDDPAVLHEIDLRLAPGEVVALVGRNGAGKTTLVTLLAGLHAPTAGTIRFPVEAEAWRKQVAVLFADFVRFPLSLRENVLLGAPDHADEAGVARALTLAGAQDLVANLPLGADTVLSKEFPGGVDLSGGQWQKVALARAIYAAQHGRRLLIMDEPTAHLDAAQETDFYDRVVRTLSGVTIVMISHRLSSVRSADRIVLLEAGRVVEQGTHADLMAARASYAQLFALQASRFAQADGQVDRP